MKNRTKGLLMAVSFMMALSFCKGLAFAHSENVAKAQGSDFDCDFICSDVKDTDNYVNYGCKELVEYTEDQAETAGIPKGFSGEVEIEYEWADQELLDENGEPNIGTHTLSLVARDYFGNEAKKEITVVVLEPDTLPPTLDIRVDTVFAKIGASVLLDFPATDDRGSVTVTKTWSDGALDSRERLTEGTHTLTVTATDASGNKTEKTVTFIVSAEGDSSDVIVDEEELFNNQTEEPEQPSGGSGTDDSVSDSSSSSDEQSPNQDASAKGCSGTLGGAGLLSLLLTASIVCFKKKRN